MALFNDLYLKVCSMVRSDEEGQGLAEYALILALVSILAIGALAVISGGINGVLSSIGNTL